MPTSNTSLLIVLRGPSGSGKSRTATALRERYGRGLAIVRQDVVRRDILRERDQVDGVNIGLIDSMARHILRAGVPCVVEGIMHAERYGAMLDALLTDHGSAAYSYYSRLPPPDPSRTSHPDQTYRDLLKRKITNCGWVGAADPTLLAFEKSGVGLSARLGTDNQHAARQ